MKFKLIIVVLIVAILVFLMVPKSKEEESIKVPGVVVLQKSPIPTPTAFPFQELTIPYLRSRNYNSKLGELKKYQENTNYTSYITNYDSDGLKINGLLTIPKDNKETYPAIVFVHGYIAPSIYKTTEKYIDYVNYLAKSGFVVFKIDLRGHGDSQGDASGAYYSGNYIIDTLNAVSALNNADFVDKNAIGLWGHSMAGNVVFRSMAAMPSIKGVVIWAGAGYSYSDLQEYRINDQSYRPPTDNTQRQKDRQKLRELYGEFDPNSDFWKKVPATNYLSDIKGVIEIHHAINDDVVSIEYSRNLIKILDSTNIAHTLFEYPTGGHNISGPSFSSAMARTVSFFKQNLE